MSSLNEDTDRPARKPIMAKKSVQSTESYPPVPLRRQHQNKGAQKAERNISSSSRTLDGYVIPSVYRPPTPMPTRAPGQIARKIPTKAPPDRRDSTNILPRPRARFAEDVHRNRPPSAKIATQVPPQSMVAAPNSITKVGTKTTIEWKPLWLQLDQWREERLMRSNNSRDRDGFQRRLLRRPIARANEPEDEDMMDPDIPTGRLIEGLRLVINGVLQDSDSSDEDNDERRQPLEGRIATKTITVGRAGPRLGTSTSSENDDDDSMYTSGKSDTETSVPPSPTEETSDIDMDDTTDGPEIILLDPPQREILTPSRWNSGLEPPAELIKAIETVSLSNIRMQKTNQLPFLLRNIRCGFYSRCRRLQVPIFTDGRESRVSVVYEHVSGGRYHVNVHGWICPLCNLLGKMRTREMLGCHMSWDHADIFCEWQQKLQTETIDAWELRLLIPETYDDYMAAQEFAAPPTRQEILPQQVTELISSSVDPVPSLYLTPSSPHSSSGAGLRSSTLLSIPKAEVKIKKDDPEKEISSTPSLTPFTLTSAAGSTPRTSAGLAVTSTSNRSNSTQNTRPLRARSGGTITPPPPEKFLGPAAQYPYVPAKSDYNGPSVKYSCKPSGPCPFDLLGTLPTEQFGLLDWDIIAREDELYSTDEDLSEEYRAILALWMRWIMLNRYKFTLDYYKGTLLFVDEYWKIIHRAAGWNALRALLLTLQVNRILKTHDVAQVIQHYEDLTNMAVWYE